MFNRLNILYSELKMYIGMFVDKYIKRLPAVQIIQLPKDGLNIRIIYLDPRNNYWKTMNFTIPYIMQIEKQFRNVSLHLLIKDYLSREIGKNVRLEIVKEVEAVKQAVAFVLESEYKKIEIRKQKEFKTTNRSNYGTSKEEQ